VVDWTDWLLLLGFLMGWAVGLIQGSANLKARVQLAIEMESARMMERMNLLESELRWAKATVKARDLDLERVQEKQSEWAKAKIQELVSEKVPMTETQKAQALAKGWGWVLGQEQEHSPKK
jgi:hypothetical protein